MNREASHAERAQVLARIRDEVWRMSGPEGIRQLLVAVRDGLGVLGIRLRDCGVNLVDRAAEPPTVASHTMNRDGDWHHPGPGHPGIALILRFWQEGRPAYRPDLQTEDPYQENRWINLLSTKPVRAIVDVPFSHGTLAINSTDPNAFDAADLAVFEELAGILSAGFSRRDDLLALEARNQQLEREIAERLQAEERLRQSEAMFATSFRLTPGSLCISRLDDGRIVDANDTFVRWSGYSLPELVGSTTAELGLWVDLADRGEVVAALRTHGSVSGREFRFRSRDGRELLCNMDAELISVQGVPCVLSALRDRTTERLAEQTLRESEERFRILAEKAPLGIALISAAGENLYFNPALVAMVGYTLEDAPTSRDWFRRAYPDPAYRRAVISTWLEDARTVGAGQTRFRTFDATCKDGSVKAIAFRPVALEDGKQLVTYEDVTVRQQAERVLRQERDYLSTVMDGNPIPSFVIDAEHRVIHWNAACERLTGASRTRMLGRRADSAVFYPTEPPRPLMADLVLDEDKVALERYYGQHHLRSSAAIPEAYEATSRLTLVGQDRVVYFLAARLRDSQGRIIGAIETLQDITESEAAREALRQSEEKYRLVVDHADEAIVIAQDGMLVFVNQKTEEMTGFPADVLTGTPFIEYIHPEDRPLVAERHRRRMRGEDVPSVYVFRIVGREGRLRWVELGAFALPWEGRPATLNFLWDVTERREADLRLQESEERFRTTFEQAAVGIAHVDLDGRWLRVNSKLCGILGYSRAELLQRTFQDVTHPDDLDADLERVRRLLAGEIPSYAMEKSYLRADGAAVWANLTVALVHDAAGAPKHFISVVEDISVRKDLEAQLEQQRLRAMQADRMHSLGEMAAGVAHELNQPLMALSTTAEDVYLRLSEGLALEKPQLQEMMQDQLSMVERMGSIIDQLRAFSQDTSDILGSAISLNETVEASLRLVGRQLANHGIQVDLRLQPELPTVQAHVHQLEEVVLNLLTNARDAVDARRTRSAKEKGGSDSAWRGRIEIRTQGNPERREACLEVRDNGGGILAEALPRLFEPFYTTKPVGKGTGLGLAIAWGIAQRHGGRLEVENRPGEGATFRLVLPVRPD